MKPLAEPALPGFSHRLAGPEDIPAISALMERAIDRLQDDYLTPEQVLASRLSMGLDTQLIEDGTYFVVEHGTAPRLAGCGGWSYRATLYGGNHSADLRDDRVLDPGWEPARIRAMYTDPDFVRRGIGRMMLSLCEGAARFAGFRRAELMATLAGEPLYLACGYRPVERVMKMSETGPGVPGVRMEKSLG